MKLITRKASSEARQRADRIIRDVHKLLGKEYRFFAGLLDHKLADVLFKIRMGSTISEARQRADRIIHDVRKRLEKEYIFFCRPIGSQARRCIVQDKNGKYDLDYQIVLTENSKGDLDPTSIKKRFLRQS